jgi:hypothetical protein
VLSGLAVIGLCAVLLILGTRSGISVNADGVTVRGQLTLSRHVPWHEVVRFEAEQIGGNRGYSLSVWSNYVTVVCRGRPALRTSVLGLPRFDGRDC